MADLEQKTVEILDKLDALATQYTPEVVDGAIAAVQVTGVGNIIWGLAGAVCAYLCWWLSRNFTQYARKKKQEDGYMSDWELGIAIGFGAGIFFTGLMAMLSVVYLFDIWNWVAIFNPKLALAHRILGL